MNQSIHGVGRERHVGPGFQAFAVEHPGNLRTGVIIQQFIDLFYRAVGGSSAVVWSKYSSQTRMKPHIMMIPNAEQLGAPRGVHHGAGKPAAALAV
jgi:hypothetical protein